jgi:hypothetical protein
VVTAGGGACGTTELLVTAAGVPVLVLPANASRELG